MKVTEHTAYHDDKKWFNRTEVFVTEVTNQTVCYRDIYGWNYGFPKLADRHQMNVAKFQKMFTHKIQMVMV